MFKKIVIANRGEIALRVLRACKELKIKTVALHSVIDRKSKHVLLADESICIGPSKASESYFNIPSIISAAEVTNADAIHPGYGFLSENADFAEKVEKSGFVFIGPSSKIIKKIGNKISAIGIMKKIGMPCLSDFSYRLDENFQNNKKIAERIGYPIVIKPSLGGGGLAINVVQDENELQKKILLTKKESKILFQNDEVYMEKFLNNPRHIEVQVISDGKGNVICLSERDCSIQRRNQKIIEEAPVKNIKESLLRKVRKLCVQVCIELNYCGVGTFEFLYKNESMYFIEVNTRIQVEHTITEMITNFDLVKAQIKIAFGLPLDLKQEDIHIFGHSIECRINAEDSINFSPSSGKITKLHVPGGLGIRWESHIYTGYRISHHYDSMIAKLISYGESREIALLRMKNALSELIIEGVRTNINFHKKILNSDSFNYETSS
ncbi:acetyl-CoA carboxylase biotin carboxylase subunit [Candidatus Riesia pediculicola]|uniref:acetyl-CoA carboxylase biotin carboxylase subunit n=1 Tax=Candidatus Riesia pediculicola TaxID=401619 RepID=UPI0009C302B5|nr:acetyl-CoA carboxylase biotin carboxylase subunit [Candidatus Riesia pediculicola]ARC54038.1 acetyl-CoA carboxylase biotin carboxylase subunit [Candidatus Riesia pediculicola]